MSSVTWVLAFCSADTRLGMADHDHGRSHLADALPI